MTRPIIDATLSTNAMRRRSTRQRNNTDEFGACGKSIGGQARAREVNRELAPLVDVMIGNEEDFTAALGFEVAGRDQHAAALDLDSFGRMIDEVLKTFPNFAIVTTTLRQARTATINDWGAVVHADGQLWSAGAIPLPRV